MVLAACLAVAILARSAQIVHSFNRAQQARTQLDSSLRIPARVNLAQHADAVSDSERVVAAHLFGSSTPTVSAQPLPAALQWVLSGIIEGDTPEAGLAIIGENAQSTRVRAVGEEVGSGFRLAQVYFDRIIIDGPAQRFALRLPHSRLGVGGAARAAELTQRAALPKLSEGIWHPPKGLIGVPLPAQVMLRPEPHRDSDGHYDGIQVTALDSRLSPLGLQRSDVITQIDGHAITSASAAQQALQQMSAGTTVMITVVRDGAPMQLPLTISESGG